MMWVAAGVIGSALAFLALQAFARTEPASLARMLRLTLPLALGVAGVTLVVLGRIGLGAGLLLGSAGWLMLGRGRHGRQRMVGRRPVVRTAALEVEVDSKSRAMAGLILAGRFEGEQLARLNLEQLLLLRQELASDPESVRLVETYLDGRFPVWREHA